MVDIEKMVSFANARLTDGSSIRNIEQNLKAMGLREPEIQEVLKQAKASEKIIKIISFTNVGNEGESEQFMLYSNGKIAYSMFGGKKSGTKFQDSIESPEAAKIFEKVREILKGVKLKRTETVFDSLSFEGKKRGYYTLVNFSEVDLSVTLDMPQFLAMEGILAPLRLKLIGKNSKTTFGFLKFLGL